MVCPAFSHLSFFVKEQKSKSKHGHLLELAQQQCAICTCIGATLSLLSHLSTAPVSLPAFCTHHNILQASSRLQLQNDCSFPGGFGFCPSFGQTSSKTMSSGRTSLILPAHDATLAPADCIRPRTSGQGCKRSLYKTSTEVRLGSAPHHKHNSRAHGDRHHFEWVSPSKHPICMLIAKRGICIDPGSMPIPETSIPQTSM